MEEMQILVPVAVKSKLTESLKTALMNEIMQKKLGLSLNDAGMLLSAVGDLKFCQVVDPERTVMMCVPKSILAQLF